MTTPTLTTLKRVQSPAPRRDWLDLLEADSTAVVEQSPRWIDALSEARSYRDASRLYHLQDGRSFVLPLVQRVGHHLAPRSGFAPSWGIGGLVGPDLDASAVMAVNADLASSPSISTHVRPNPSQGEIWQGIPDADAIALNRRAHVLELATDPDETFAGLSQGARRNVRKAAKRGAEVKVFTGGDHLGVYYDELFLPSVQRWADKQNEPLKLARLRAQRRDPLNKLQAIAGVLGDSFRLTLAYVDGQVAAGNIVLATPNAHYTRGAINELGETTNAAYAAMWHAIEHACLDGLNWFHMGETGSSSSLASYKERFGAVAYDYCEYRYERVPLLAVDQRARAVVKRLIKFDDAS